MSLTTLIAFIIGIFIGGQIGCFITCLVIAGRDNSEEERT